MRRCTGGRRMMRADRVSAARIDDDDAMGSPFRPPVCSDRARHARGRVQPHRYLIAAVRESTLHLYFHRATKKTTDCMMRAIAIGHVGSKRSPFTRGMPLSVFRA